MTPTRLEYYRWLNENAESSDLLAVVNYVNHLEKSIKIKHDCIYELESENVRLKEELNKK